ncbi:amidohydrolase [Candidatus Palauibacter sp.]|uniref:amidohydrolase n=1 Tax=Candidatus Palauibacter sp. TaxID=3101350 RepID=UPI003B5198C8
MPKIRPSRAAVAPAAGYLAALGLVACAEAPREAADLVLVDGEILTLGATGVVEALAVADGRVSATGTSEEIRMLAGPDTRVVDLGGRTVIPGLTDNHYHGIGGGPGVDLTGARSMADVVDAIAAVALETAPGELIVTNRDWHEGQLAEHRLPYRDDLDGAAPGQPVVVVRGGHEYVLNSAALARWGIDESTPEVPGGRIGRYPDGRLNGELVDRAKDLVTLPAAAPPDPAATLDALAEEYAALNARGLTSIRYPGGPPEQYRAIARLRDAGRLTLRVNYVLRAPRGAGAPPLDEALATWPAMGEGDAWLRVGGAKLGVDGGFEGGLMREPYEEPWGEGGTFHGLQTLPTERYIETVRELHRQGWRVATHAVGDAAIDLVLDGYEAANADAPIDGLRWVIEHGFIPREEHFSRMRALGLSVTAQNHLYVAAPSLVKYWGADRAAWTTPVRAYLDAGIPVSLGTDSPVIPWDPWWMLHHFTTRGTISAGVLDPAQAITREEALRAVTSGYAHLTFEEEEKGTLEVGMAADLIVTAEHVLECEDPCLESMEVDLTLVDGRVVYER